MTGLSMEDGTTATELPRTITPYVFFTCFLAGSGGLMYGYDLVVAGICRCSCRVLLIPSQLIYYG